MSSVKRDFDKEALAWDENPLRVRLANDVRAAILREITLTAELDMLDFGCGTGLLSLPLADQVRTLTGVDSSAGMLQVFSEKAADAGLDNVQYQLIDLDADGRLSGQFGLAVSSMTLHHIRDIDALLRSLHAVLTPGGRLCLADLDPDGGLFHSDNTGVFHFGFDRNWLVERLTAAGFADITVGTASEIAKPDGAGGERRFSIFLIGGRRA